MEETLVLGVRRRLVVNEFHLEIKIEINHKNRQKWSLEETNETDKQTHLHRFHGTNHHDGLHHPRAEATQQTPGAVQSTRLVLRFVTEELKDPEPSGNHGRSDVSAGEDKHRAHDDWTNTGP